MRKYSVVMSVCLSFILCFYGLEILNGLSSIYGYLERYWCVDVSFDSFDRIRSTSDGEKSQNIDFYKHQILWPRTMEGNARDGSIKCLVLVRPQPQSWGPIELGCPSVRPSVRPSVCPSVIAFLYGLELLNGRS